MNRLGRVALLCVALALSMIAPSSGWAASKAIWGPLTLDFDGRVRSAFPTYRDLRVDMLHYSLRWPAVAPTRPLNARDPADPAYHWPAELDYAISEGQRYGVKIVALAWHTPAWANDGRGENWAPARDQDFADFVYAASLRYPAIRHWMIWGEPSRQVQFNPMPKDRPRGPRRYARLLDRAFVALKRANRRNIVIGGNTFTVGDVFPADFVRWMRLPNGKPPRLDWFGHNPFSTRFPELSDPPLCGNCRDFGDIDTYIREIRRAYRPLGRKPRLWLSEWTIQSDHASDQFQFYVSREVQANWIRRGFRIARRHSYVAGLGWFSLTDEPGPPGGVSRNWGLLTTSGGKKPAYVAYKQSYADGAALRRARHACMRRADRARTAKKRARLRKSCTRRYS